MKFEELLARKDYLHLSEITDEGDNRLRAVVCIGGHHRVPNEIMGKHVDEIARMPIQYTKASYYELRWDRYFWFAVQDECFAPVRKEDEFSGHGFRRFKKSWLLMTVPQLSNGLHETHGKLMHFGLYCLNHIVDVLAYAEPGVRDLGLREVAPKMPTPPSDTSAAGHPLRRP